MTISAIMETSKGTLELELYDDKPPVTAKNFAQYIEEGFFDGTVFHRVIPGFVIQGGGFTVEGEQKTTHAPIKLEVGLDNKRGTLSMARTMDPNSATSQFFVSLVDNKSLNPGPRNPGYAVFGHVTKGMDIIDGIAAAPTESKGMHQDWPRENIIITRAYLK